MTDGLPKQVRALEEMTVWACNARTAKGHRARKDRKVTSGEQLTVLREYISSSLVFHGDRIYVVEQAGYQLHIHARCFEDA